uniref:Uncharacterized protein n=1 Tax=Anolis carolinensis TaxID=28377 RepID=A0A803T5T6_ANOCA
MAVGLRSLEAVLRKTQSLQELTDAAEARAERLQRELDKERALQEQQQTGQRVPFPPSFSSTDSLLHVLRTRRHNVPLLFLLLFNAISRSENTPGLVGS